MSLKVIDGVRTVDGTNAAIDIPYATYAAANTTNGASHDMKDHFEFIATLHVSNSGTTTTIMVNVQESNDGSTWANIANAGVTVGVNTQNKSYLISVDWKHPSRKRFSRLQSVIGGASTSAVFSASGMRVAQSGGNVAVDSNVTAI